LLAVTRGRGWRRFSLTAYSLSSQIFPTINSSRTVSTPHAVTLAVSCELNHFYSAPHCSHCKRCTSYSNSICLSVRLSHAGIVSKRRQVARCSLHCQIAKCVYFCRNEKNIPQGQPLPPEILAPSDIPSPDSNEF